MKIKLPFAIGTTIEDREHKLYEWAQVLVNYMKVNILEEKHFETISYIIIENTYVATNKKLVA